MDNNGTHFCFCFYYNIYVLDIYYRRYMFCVSAHTAAPCTAALCISDLQESSMNENWWFFPNAPQFTCFLSPSAADSFNHKTFFAKVGLSGKSEAEVKKAFDVIDQDRSGFIEEDELK